MSDVLNKELILKDAQTLLAQFIEAEEKEAQALSLSLRPETNDYFKIFSQDMAMKYYNAYESYFWSDADAYTIRAKNPENTDLYVHLCTSFELRDFPEHQEKFPGGYEQVVEHYAHDVPILRFKFVPPASTTGMAYDGLYYIPSGSGNRFVFIPKPWRIS